DADLAARRPGQELAQGDEIGVGAIVEPATALDELGMKVAQVRRGPAEGDETELQEREQDLEGRAHHAIVLVQGGTHGPALPLLSRPAPGEARPRGLRRSIRCAADPAASPCPM